MPTTRPSSSPPSARPRALVVSHPCIVPVNQSVFNVVAERGWSVDLVVPARWKHDYADGEVAPGRLPDLKARFIPAPVALPGQPQRHLYRPGVTSRVLAEPSPSVAFLEEETFSVPAFQWGVACRRRGIPFGVQADENLDRPLPLPAQLLRAWTLRNAAFVAARSPKAKEMVERWGARGRVEVIPHAVPLWDTLPRPESSGVFTIGFAGRFVEEKGLRDLVSAAHRLTGQTRLLLTGNGPMREELSGVARNGLEVEIVSDISHDDMATAYARMDVLGVAVPHDAHLGRAVRPSPRRGALVWGPRDRLRLRRDPVGDQHDGRRSPVPRGRRRRARERPLRAASRSCHS